MQTEEEREKELNADIDSIQNVLEEEKNKAEEYLSSWQRTQADFANYKRRTEQERSELITSANAGLILDILPIMDDMERALDSLPEASTELAWVEGIQLIYRKLQSMLGNRGLKEIQAAGQVFDPHFHEAVAYEEGGEEGIIVRETQKGYILGDRVLRPSLVTVGKGVVQSNQQTSTKRRDRKREP